MSALQLQITQSLDGLSDDSLSFILNMIQNYVVPAEARNTSENANLHVKERKLGSRKGMTFIASGHDLDEHNDEIAEMFGEND